MLKNRIAKLEAETAPKSKNNQKIVYADISDLNSSYEPNKYKDADILFIPVDSGYLGPNTSN